MLSIKDTFFAHVGNHGSVSIVDTMLQHCMLERVLLSPVDAVYCTQFALLFNELDVSLHYVLIFFLISSYLDSNSATVTFICRKLYLSFPLILNCWPYLTCNAIMSCLATMSKISCWCGVNDTKITWLSPFQFSFLIFSFLPSPRFSSLPLSSFHSSVHIFYTPSVWHSLTSYLYT